MVQGWVVDLPVHRASAGGAVQGQQPRRELACLRGRASGHLVTGVAHRERVPAREPPRGSALPVAGGSCTGQKQPYQGLQGIEAVAQVMMQCKCIMMQYECIMVQYTLTLAQYNRHNHTRGMIC